MTPTLFGSSERQLFGVFTPATGERRRRGAVICPAWGQEYQRTHRACRMLAERMSQRGHDVLRFDYYGTGDSGGVGGDVTLAGCVSDTIAAVEEVVALAEVRKVTLIGLRFGAVVAQRAADASRAVDRVVLWDPISIGAHYIQEVLQTAMGGGRVHAGQRYIGGFALSPHFEEELAAVQPAGFVPARARATLVVTSDEAREHGDLVDVMRAAGDNGVQWDVRPGPRSWVEQEYLGVGAIPVEILDRIASWEGAAS